MSLNLSELKLGLEEMQSGSTGKRSNYIDWAEYFMATAFLAAKRSKDPVTQVGAVIVNDHKIVGVGYNGFPRGCSDDEFPWTKDSENLLENKYMYVVHAEINAILNKTCADTKGCSMYVALFPCNECAKVIIQSGFKEVVYMSDKYAHKDSTIAAKRMFNANGIKYTQFIPKTNKIIIDFSEIDNVLKTQNPDTPK